ncbi:alpha-crystallin domain-containing protein 22.3-like [Bidens hawaiensis]|uniref:alpha-crystallin domain-containing protein 22.3-like n=1 Tax=Bidens hawaiensis TaxID=980011 RepID=UPI00404B6FDA
MCATPLNSVLYTGPPLDHSQQNEANLVLKNHPSIAFLPQPTTVKELNNMLSDTKNGIAVSGSATSGQIGKNEKFKCDVQEGGTVTIHGATSTGGKKVHSHNMVFNMHTKNLCPP